MPISPKYVPSELHYIIPLAERHGSDAPVAQFDHAVGRHVRYAETLSAEDIAPLRPLYAEILAQGHVPLIKSWLQGQDGKDKCPSETTWPIHGLLCLFQQLGDLGVAPFGDGMDPKPFVSLTAPRMVEQFGLPSDLARFYAANEGVGLESSPDRSVRLCRLDEVARIAWRHVHIFGADELPGWERFAAFRVGISPFFDEIVYVLNAPVCQAGSILTISVDVAGPGGYGSATLEPSLVLASSFTEWLKRLEACGWTEYGLGPGDLAKLPAAEERQQRRYYQTLNPGLPGDQAVIGILQAARRRDDGPPNKSLQTDRGPR
jgi:hypothetical protein